MDMEYYKFGRGRKALVILPGLSVQSVMGSKALVEEGCRLLTDEYTLYLMDRRRDIPEAYSIAEMAEDTAEKIEELGLERVSVFGASQGGMIAMRMALDHPELVDKLILGSTTARVDEARFKTIGGWVELAEKGDAKALYLAFGEDLYPRELFEASKKQLLDMAECVSEEELKRFVILAKAMIGFDVTAELPALSCPVLVMGDRDDRVFDGGSSPEIADILRGHSGLELYMYEGFGHAVFDTAPDYKERMLSFLKGA